MDVLAGITAKVRSASMMLTVPGAFTAWREGCHVTVYTFVKRLQDMGIAPATVLDIGANRGMFARCIRRVFPDAEMFAFEPLLHCFAELLELEKTTPLLRCYPYALGDKNGTATLYRSSYDYSSSMLPMGELHKQIFPRSATTSEETVELRTLDSIAADLPLRRPVLMKIDVQGYELAVLRGAIRTLQQIDYVVCEISLRPLYEGQTKPEDVHAVLQSAGLMRATVVDELRAPGRGTVLQQDVLFVRSRV